MSQSATALSGHLQKSLDGLETCDNERKETCLFADLHVGEGPDLKFCIHLLLSVDSFFILMPVVAWDWHLEMMQFVW